MSLPTASITTPSSSTDSGSGKSYSSERNKNKIKSDNNSDTQEDHRLWIGNLDPKLTEFHLLKLVQRFGHIDNFDFLFHRSGPNAGLPRGYAFVTYRETQAAHKCMQSLDGKRILEKYAAVRWAHQAILNYPDDEEKLRQRLPVLGMKSVEESTPASKEKTISAIEAKLRAMEREKDQQNFNVTTGNSQGSSANSFRSQSGAYHHHYTHNESKFRPKPYERQKRYFNTRR